MRRVCGNPYCRQMSRTSQNHDLEDDLALVRIFSAWICSGSPYSRATIPNRLSMRRWTIAVPGKLPPKKWTTDRGVFCRSFWMFWWVSLTLSPRGSQYHDYPGGGGHGDPPLRNQWRSYYWTHVAKNYLLVFIFVVQMQKKLDKILIFGQFFVFSAEMKNIGIKLKWPPIGQMWIFLGLVFCKHPYFYSTNWFCNKNIGL